VQVIFEPAKQRSNKKKSADNNARKYLLPYSVDPIVNCIDIYNDYLDRLEKRNIEIKPERNFWIQVYDKSKFTNQSISRKFSNAGMEIAKLLKLPNPESFTGHCFRRTSATSMADNGATVTELQRKFGWANPKTAMEYVSNSKASMMKDAALLSLDSVSYSPKIESSLSTSKSIQYNFFQTLSAEDIAKITNNS